MARNLQNCSRKVRMKGDDPEIVTAQTPKPSDGHLALTEKIRKTDKSDGRNAQIGCKARGPRALNHGLSTKTRSGAF